MNNESIAKNSEKIRILYLLDALNYGHGGTEHHLKWLLNNIPDDRFEKYFIAMSNPDHLVDPATWIPAPIVLSDTCGYGIQGTLKKILAVSRFIHKHRIDLVQAFSSVAEMTAGLAVILSRRGKVIGNRRDIGFALNFKLKMLGRIARLSKIRYVANSKAAKEAAFKLEKIPLKKIEVIGNPIPGVRMDLGLADPILRSEIKVPEDAPLVGMVATVRPIKGYDVLLHAAKIVLEKKPETYFVFVGIQQEGTFPGLLALADKLKISDHLCWFGTIENSYRILPHFTVAVLSSLSESFSNAVLEYASSGLPIVASDVGGMSEIVTDDESGYLVPPKEPELLAERILDLLEHPEKRLAFGRKAKEHVLTGFAYETILAKYVDFYTRFKG